MWSVQVVYDERISNIVVVVYDEHFGICMTVVAAILIWDNIQVFKPKPETLNVT